VLSVREAGVSKRLDREGTASDEPRAVGELRPQQIGGAAAVLGAGDRLSGRLQRHEGLSCRVSVGFERGQLRPATIGPLFRKERSGGRADVRGGPAGPYQASSCIARSWVVRGVVVRSQSRARATYHVRGRRRTPLGQRLVMARIAA
jgi:hypothetical protein